MVKKLLFTSVNLRVLHQNVLLMMFFLFGMSVSSFAWDANVDGIYYNFSGNTATVTYAHVYNNANYYYGSVIIPSTVTYNGKSYSVSSIGYEAFVDCKNLTSVTVPNSVRSIGNNAFKGCTSLKTIKLLDGSTTLSVGNHLTSYPTGYGYSGIFNDCPLETVYYGRMLSFKTDVHYPYPPFYNTSIKNLEIGESITVIDEKSFANCSQLKNVVLSSTLKTIGDRAFRSCSNLSSISIPNTVVSIGEESFAWSGLNSVTIPSNVRTIGSYAFNKCTKLTDVNILASLTKMDVSVFANCSLLTDINLPITVKEIGRYAFQNCGKLGEIHIPNSIKKIGAGAFAGCNSLTKIEISDLSKWLDIDFSDKIDNYYANPLCYGHNLYIDGTLIKDLSIPTTVRKLNEYTFHGCSIEFVSIPNTIIDIEENTFLECNQLKKIYLDCPSVKSWFKGLKGIKELWFGESVKSIEKSAFEGCTGLDEIHFSNSIESVGQWAFNDCNGLSAIHISDIAKWCNMNFEFSSNNSKHTNPLYYAHNLYLNDHLVKECVIPYGVKEIKDFVFEGCNMESIFIPSTVIKIGSKQTFNECNNLKAVNITDLAAWCKIDFTDGNASNYIHGNPLCYAHNLYLNKELVNDLVIPSSISAIKEWTFDGCASIRSVFIPDGICTIGYGAFHNCAEMEFLSIPHTITSISNNSFSDCPKLVQLVSFSNNVLSVTNECVVLVPSSIVNRYQTGKIFPIVTDETTQSTIKLSSTEQFVLKQAACEEYNGNGAVIKKQEKNAVDGTILFSGVAPDRNHLITITGEAFGKVVSGSFVIKTKPLVINIERISATNLTIKVKGSYEGDAQVTNTNFGDYGNGIETTISNLYPGQSLIVTFNVTTSDGSVSSISKWFETIPVKANVSCKTTSSSCAMTGSYSVIDATIVSSGFQQNDYQSDMLMVHGLEPGTAYYNQYTYRVNIKEGGSVSQSVSFKTNALKMATLAPKVISLGNVIVAAETNLDDEEENVGFEWRRTDWTNDFASSTGTAVLYEGTMEGYIRNMNAEKLWKVRPYYLSNSGKYYYGDWMGLDPSNTSYFEPTVHTYAKISVEGNTALVKGYALRGTDGVKVQGFKYWKQTAGVRNRATAIPSNAITVEANGQVMTASLTDLDFESKYCYVAFVTTTEGETFYGEQLTFTTGSDPTGIENVPNGVPTVTVVARYDVNGRRIATAQSGLNILRMSDGTCCKVWVK